MDPKDLNLLHVPEIKVPIRRKFCFGRFWGGGGKSDFLTCCP